MMDMPVYTMPDFLFKVPHHNWKEAFAQLYTVLSYAEPGDVICVTGPSRVGKSTLISEVMHMLCGEAAFHATGEMPFIRVSAKNTGPNGTFSTRGFAQRLLNAVEHPIYAANKTAAGWVSPVGELDKKTEWSIMLMVERAFINRRVRYLAIDEGQHAIYSVNAKMAPHAVMDSWKCFAEDAGAVLIISGAYPILKILQSSPHLVGRKNQIHFPRYSAEKDDIQHFGEILATFGESIVMAGSTISLLDHAELLYSGSLGCLGLLRSWLKRACAFAVAEKAPLSENHLIKTVLSDSDLGGLLAEIQEGEESLESTISTVVTENLTKKPTEKVRLAKSKSKPFQRKATRYNKGGRLQGEGDA